VIPCACLTRSDVTGSHVTFPILVPVFSRIFPVVFSYFFPVCLFEYFFFVLFFPYFFPRIFFYRTYFFPYYFPRIFSKLATFEIQHFKISISCFSSTCRYSTVHVPCGIAIQTSPIGLPLDGSSARMCDLKGPRMNLFNPKEH
jgi:hypothetical protein